MLSLNVFNVLAAADPSSVINSVFTDIKGWLIGIFLTVTVAIVIYHGIEYQKGNDDEKARAIKHIKGKIAMTAGIFILIWLATYAFGKFKVLG